MRQGAEETTETEKGPTRVGALHAGGEGGI